VQSLHPRADRLYDAHSFISDQRRKLRLHWVRARPKQGLGAIQADGFDCKANLARSGLADVHVFDPQLLRPAVLIHPDDFTHR